MAIADNIKKLLTSSNITMDSFYSQVHSTGKYYDLSLDYPIMEPPLEFSHTLKDLIENPMPGMHRYMENSGYTYTRDFIAKQFSEETNKNFSQSNIIMTCGSAGAFNMVLKTLLNPNEEVITFLPCIKEYEYYISNHGGICKTVSYTEDFMPDLTALENALSENTRALIINSPNNPSGKIYSDKVLKQIVDIINRKSAENKSRIYIISDDVFSKYCYVYDICPRILTYYPHTISIYSYSQELGLPGERIGYMAVDPDCEDARDVMAGLIYSSRVLGYINAPALMQNAIYKFGNKKLDLEDITRKKDYLIANLEEIGYTPVKPDGGYFLLVKSPISNDLAFVEELKKQGVLTVPGSNFKAPGYFRLSYCVEDSTLESSLPGLNNVLKNNH